MATIKDKIDRPVAPLASRPTLLECDEFPFEFLSELAERESWRKEIHRPVYHLHKWWATRLGSVFRGVLLGCVLPPGSEFDVEFYRQHNRSDVTILDPFMGSGTTIGEAHKLGFTALGRDINPVAAEAVRVAMGPLEPHLIEEELQRLEHTVGHRIRQLYKVVDERGGEADVLYFFWVKHVSCTACENPVDLFSSRIIGRNAFPDRKPDIRILCPGCGDVFSASIHDAAVTCRTCEATFSPHEGNAVGAKARCGACGSTFTILDSVRKTDGPPSHRLIAKLILQANGEKHYLPATDADRTAYAECANLLASEEAKGGLRLPTLNLQHGHNTRQAMNYGYRSWRDFFNDRQLLALGWLHKAISDIAHETTRDAILTLFSSTLEFNNVFASYKGEGTGAVRHMFAHHILKPERMPIEANVWGTPKSSGAFSGLYRTRLVRAIEYRRAPVEVPRPRRGVPQASNQRALQCSEPFTGNLHTAWPPQFPLLARSIHLSCGSSDKTDLPAECADFVVTDPPFFDNVHYSELADFFFAWQVLEPRGFLRSIDTTRSNREVQDTCPEAFASKLAAVFAECHRVLKNDGLLVFTYHHSRAEGWSSLASALRQSGFNLVNAHPVRAEMSVATPKAQAKEPIQLDIIMICRKRSSVAHMPQSPECALLAAVATATAKASRLHGKGIVLSRNDRRIILFSQFLVELGSSEAADGVVHAISNYQSQLETALDDASFIAYAQHQPGVASDRPEPDYIQRSLFDGDTN